MKISGPAACLLAATLLAACGNSETESPLLTLGRSVLPGQDDAPAAAPDAETVARTALTRLREPVMVAEIGSLDAVAALVPYGVNGPVTTWTTVDFQTISLTGGRVVATRGLGADLMAVSENGGARTYHLMNAANEDVSVRVTCTAVAAAREKIRLSGGEGVSTTRIDETCEGSGLRFVNSYWAGTDGSLRRSRQWLGPIIGHIELQRLR